MNWNLLKQWLLALSRKHDNYDYLSKFPILSGFSKHELFLFAQIVQERVFKEGEEIYQDQSPLAVLYLIKSGTVQIREEKEGQNRLLLRHRHQFIGIVDMYNDSKRHGDATALKDTVLLAVSHLDFQAFLKNNTSTGVKLLNNICKALSHYIISDTVPIEA
jgi:signal-transduction protein with cAMP-binding, CBS, and nucleotidyltransferase domain